MKYKLTDYLSRYPKEESSTGENYEKMYVFDNLSEFFKK